MQKESANRYLIKYFQDQSIQKTFYLILKKRRSTGYNDQGVSARTNNQQSTHTILRGQRVAPGHIVGHRLETHQDPSEEEENHHIRWERCTCTLL